MSGIDLEKIEKEELFTALSSMGISIPDSSKMPVKALKKKLKDAFQRAQNTDQLIERPPLSPQNLALWSQKAGGKSVVQAIPRGNAREAFTFGTPDYPGRESVLSRPTTFLKIRAAVARLAEHWDKGVKNLIVTGGSMDTFCSIFVRFVAVHYLNDETPVITLLYLANNANKPDPGLLWMRESFPNQEDVPHVSLDQTEQKVFLCLLDSNAMLLDPSYNPSVERTTAEATFKMTFLLPVGPLDNKALSHFNADFGCVVCGKRTASRCSQCQSVAYCGPECQKSDWASHKLSCKSIKGGTWRKVVMMVGYPGIDLESLIGPNGVATNVSWDDLGNNFKSKDTNTFSMDKEKVLPNVHGNKPFLVKIQVGLGGNPQHFLVYDRQRTFQCTVWKEKDPDAFKQIHREMRLNGVAEGMKMYRWAKRTGDWEMDICVDRAPSGPPMW